MSEEVLSIQDASAQMIAAGQMFEMERTTVKGIEMNVWKNAPQTMAQVLGMSLNHSAKEFLVYEDQRYTFEEHYRAAATLAQRFIDLGIKKGDRITIASRNLPQWVMSFWGAILSGAVVVPLNACGPLTNWNMDSATLEHPLRLWTKSVLRASHLLWIHFQNSQP